MNCKPGDLAIVISVPFGVHSEAIGKVVRVLNFQTNGLWRLESELLITALCYGKTIAGDPVKPGEFIATGWPDEHLWPLRGNEGEDETLQWAPVPVKEIA